MMNMMMINDHHDEHNEHDDEHIDDDVMHDMHTNTMHHARCQRMPQRQHTTIMHKHAKQCKKQKKCYKNMQKHAKRETTMAFKKTMATFRDEREGGPNPIRDPLKWDPRHKTRQGTQQNETHTTQFM